MAYPYDLGPTYAGLGNLQPLPTRQLPSNTTITPTPRPTYSPTSGSNPSAWQQTNSFLSSPGGQLAVGGLATGLGAYVNSKQRQEDREASAEENALNRQQSAEEARANLLARLSESLLADQRARATSAVRPLGDAQQFALRAARSNAVADLLGGGPAMPSNPAIAGAIRSMPQISPDAIARIRQASSPNAVAAGLARQEMDLNRVDPGRTSTLGQDAFSLSGLSPSSPFLAHLLQNASTAHGYAQDDVDASQSYARQLLAAAIDGTDGPVYAQQPQAPAGGRAVSPFRHSR